MRSLSELLHRLRGLSAPPGAPARAIAVPSKGEDLAGELEALMPKLDAIDEQARLLLTRAQEHAADIEARAQTSAVEILTKASERAERERAQIVAAGRAQAEREAAEIIAAGEAESRRVSEHATRRAQTLVDEIVASLRQEPR